MAELPTMFAPAPSSEPVSALNDYIQPNLGHALRIWWAYWWPTTLIVFALSYLMGLAVRVLYENVVLSANVLKPVAQYGSYVINYVVAFFVLRYVLGKTFRHFRVGLISNAETARVQILKPTLTRTMRVWWVFTWRTVLYGLLGLAFVIYPMQWFVNIFRPGVLFTTLFFILLGTAIGGALALFVIYSNILEEDFGDFQVVLLPRELAVPASSPLTSNPAPLG